MDVDASAGQRPRRAAHRAANSETLDMLARWGRVCRSVMYALVGFLAFQVAFGSGREADKTGAIRTIAAQPLGGVVLWLMVAGFAALALWQLSDALMGTGELTDRLGAGARTVVYGFVVATLLSFTLRGGTESGDKQSRDLTDWLLHLPGGQLVVGAVGVGLLGLAAVWVFRGVTRRFMEDLRTERMPSGVKAAVQPLGIVGNLARGAVAGLAGYFMLQAAITYQPDRAKGVDATLRAFADTAAGPWVLGAVATGLLLFAGYCLCEAFFHKPRPAS